MPNWVLAPNKGSKYEWPNPSPPPSTTVHFLWDSGVTEETTSFLQESVVIMSPKASFKVFVLMGKEKALHK